MKDLIMKDINSEIRLSHNSLGFYNVGEDYFIGVLISGNLEIRNCQLLEFVDDNIVKVKIENHIPEVTVNIDILKAKKRWVDRAIEINS
jgi:hypothetical protein